MSASQTPPMPKRPATRIVWPPQIMQHTPLGYVYDTTGNWYPRDIGRSTSLSNGLTIYQFGDTFCHNRTGDFLGVADNTCAIVTSASNPTLSSYHPQVHNPSHVQGEMVLESFIKKRSEEQDTEHVKWKIWCFSGIVELGRSGPGGPVVGVCFYELRKWESGVKEGEKYRYQYTGIAQVEYDPLNGDVFKVSRGDSKDNALFKIDEPRFGGMCIVSDDKYIYAYGRLYGSRDVGVARVPIWEVGTRSSYEYWSSSHSWNKDITSSTFVLPVMQHGQIFPTTLFGSASGYNWAFLGTNCFGDSKCFIGRAKKPEGPWEVEMLKLNAYTMNDVDSTFRYCFYAHPWAFDSSKGDLMISWNEGGMRGSVTAEKLRFEMTVDD